MACRVLRYENRFLFGFLFQCNFYFDVERRTVSVTHSVLYKKRTACTGTHVPAESRRQVRKISGGRARVCYDKTNESSPLGSEGFGQAYGGV